VVKWSAGGGQNIQRFFPSTPAVADDGLIYYGGLNSNVNFPENFFYAFNPNGTTNWQFALQAPVLSSPAVASDGTIYFGAGAFYALKGNSPLANSPWPKFRQNLRNTGKVEKPQLKNPRRAAAGFEADLFGEMGQSYTVQTSTNFLNWTSLTSIVCTTLPELIMDPCVTGFPFRVYRAISP
jgi:hypothetical protein